MSPIIQHHPARPLPVCQRSCEAAFTSVVRDSHCLISALFPKERRKYYKPQSVKRAPSRDQSGCCGDIFAERGML
jgi:hypothetical protein